MPEPIEIDSESRPEVDSRIASSSRALVADAQDIVLHDMTQQQPTPQEDYYRLLAENVIDFGMFITDTEGRINAWNIGARHIFGWTEAEIVGQMIRIIFTGADQMSGMPEAEMGRAREDGRSDDVRWHVRKDGTLFFASGIMTALRDEETGELRGYGKIIRDATKEHADEDALRRANEDLQAAHAELEARVEERTAQLTVTLQDLKSQSRESQRLTARMVVAQEDERRRISRELHDQTGQHLTGLALGLKTIEEGLRTYYPGETRLDEELMRVRRTANELSRDLHRIAVELRPTALDDLGLIEALNSYVEQWSEQTGIPADFETIGIDRTVALLPDSPGGADFADLVQITIYRVVQEALTNVTRHAINNLESGKATLVSITMQRFNSYLQVAIEDDGPGFDVALARSGRLGLEGMRERATACGGTLEIESTPGDGTTIFLRIPLSTEFAEKNPFSPEP